MKNYDVIVIGTGAAGYNAACRIKEDGRKTVCIVTEGINSGTSRNTGSDKQTYYKLGLGGSAPDSVRSMAETLFNGGCVDGDIALCEAALSARCFYNLCESGVPFPCNRYGEYIGYKTDHDPFARATSVGPLTSKFMTEALQKKAENLGVETIDKYLAIEILKNEDSVCGLLCLNLANDEFEVLKCSNIVIATGGPAGIYFDSVYPGSHNGFSSLALMAGAKLRNMTEWQYGLASVNPRWNVSGTYMQVLPRFVSIDEDGNEYEFLSEFFDDIYEAMSVVFLKGYQWPFDIKKVMEGSSVVDLLVYREKIMRGRKVYLDFTKNPFGLSEIEYEKLSKEAYEYLYKAEACFGTPIERLEKMNLPAIKLYESKGTDITKEYLEIALCSQHNNGGISVDKWWKTDVKGLFAIGECAGTHGVARPGGSALNAGQVGALRAAQYILEKEDSYVSSDVFNKIKDEAILRNKEFIKTTRNGTFPVLKALDTARKDMSRCGAAIRNVDEMKKLSEELTDKLNHIGNFKVSDKIEIRWLYRLKDTFIVQLAVINSMLDYIKNTGASRGSALYTDENGNLRNGLEEIFKFNIEGADKNNSRIQEISFKDNKWEITWREVNPIPCEDNVFETVWREYRNNKNVY